MRFHLHTTLALLILLLAACGGDKDSDPPALTPEPEDIEPDHASATILLQGEGFPEEGKQIVLPGTEQSTTSTYLDILSPLPHRETNTISILSLQFGQTATTKSIFLAITDPQHPHHNDAPDLGIWIRATGPVVEEGRFPCETGTRLVIDGTPYLPVASSKPLESPAGPTVDATFTIDEIRSDQWHGTLTGTFAPANGSPHIDVEAKLIIPAPKDPPESTDS